MNMLATRASNTFCIPRLTREEGGLLVKIHPAAPLEQPFPLASCEITLGRDLGCELRTDDDSISRRHASIECDNGQYRIKDLGSTNGTFVNEVRIGSSHPLSTGDRIRIGNHIFKFLSIDGIEGKYHEVVFKMMTTDGLTQIYNKRFFIEMLEREFRQSLRNRQPLCLLLMDLDHFKSINDTYGHLAGDAVLAAFAQRASSVLRGGELFARYGGEEFVMLCPCSTLSQAAVSAERIREAISKHPVSFDSKEIPITVSIGIAEIDGDSSIEEFIARADATMYRAKQDGRNRVCF